MRFQNAGPLQTEMTGVLERSESRRLPGTPGRSFGPLARNLIAFLTLSCLVNGAGPNAATASAATGQEAGQGQGTPKNRLAGLQLAWVEPDKTEPPGTQYRTFFSPTIQGEVSYLIYLPPDYGKDRQTRYPVLYWLHGSGATQPKGGRIAQMVDQAIRAGKLPGMIVVLVNGLRGATMYCDMKNGNWPLETVLVSDLIPHIDATYQTRAERGARAVEGFSMGGFGAAHLGFKYPDLFGVVSILAPALLGPELQSEMPRRKWFEHLAFVFDGDMNSYRANNPFELIEENAEKIRGRSIIRLVPHDEEGQWLIPRCEQLHAVLEKYRIAHTFDVRDDVKAHNYGLLYSSLGEEGLGFFARAFGAGSDIGPDK